MSKSRRKLDSIARSPVWPGSGRGKSIPYSNSIPIKSPRLCCLNHLNPNEVYLVGGIPTPLKNDGVRQLG